jgi:hypothetical protein
MNESKLLYVFHSSFIVHHSSFVFSLRPLCGFALCLCGESFQFLRLVLGVGAVSLLAK